MLKSSLHRSSLSPSRRVSAPASRHATLLTALACGWPLSSALAQDAKPPATPGQLQTVTVTAERTAENAKDVPSSVSTLSGEKLDVLNSSGADVRLLASRVPSLNVESSYGRAFPRFYIRGYGNVDFRSNASQPVSLIYDDIVQESPLLKGFPIFDLDRVEVLSGPQGTLFGRNTPAGVVKFDSAKPRIGATDGYASLSYGRFQTINFEGAASLPLGPTMAARISGVYQKRDDWVSNTRPTGTREYEGYDDRAIRGQLLYKPSGDLSALFNLHARDARGSARVFRANIFKKGSNELVDGFDPSKVSFDADNSQFVRIVGSNLHLSASLAPDLVLSSITGYETVKSYSRGDIDGGYGAVFAPPSGPGVIAFPSETAGGLHDHGQFSQELRLESKYSGPLNWQTGIYFFDEKFTSDSYAYSTLTGGNLTSLLHDTQKTRSYAAFGSLRYDVTPAFQLRGGLRWTHDKKTLNSDRNALGFTPPPVTTASLSDSKPSGDLSGVYKIDPAVNVYARVATGYRGSSVQAASLFGGQSLAGQENNLSFETGVKADLLNKRARVSASVFRYRVKDYQLTEVGGGSNANILLAANKVIGQGFELNLDAFVTDQLLVTVSGSVNDTKIKSPGLSVGGCGSVGTPATRVCTITDPIVGGRAVIDGNPLPNAPKYIANLTARYGIPMANSAELYVYTDWAYRSKVNFFLYESKEFTGKALTEGGLRVGYLFGEGKYDAAVFVRNLTNRVQATGAIDFNNLTGFINDPRTWGVQFKANF